MSQSSRRLIDAEFCVMPSISLQAATSTFRQWYVAVLSRLLFLPRDSAHLWRNVCVSNSKRSSARSTKNGSVGLVPYVDWSCNAGLTSADGNACLLTLPAVSRLSAGDWR